MINIDDIEIKIKKYDREKNVVILNLILFEQVEMRGFTVRYTETKYSHGNPVWVITPPSIKGRNKAWFHIVRIKDSALWQQIQKRIIEEASEHANSLG